MKCRPRAAAWCVKCGKDCCMGTTDFHRAGSPCTDHSAMGLNRGLNGPNAKIFWTWVALRRRWRDRIILHENVPSFGEAELNELMSDLYIIIRDIINPRDMGWPTTRNRQICLMILKCFIHPALEGCTPCLGGIDHHAAQQVDFCNTVRQIFYRSFSFTFHEFMVATPEEQDEMKTWMRNRKAVKERHSGNDEFKDDRDDPNNWLAWLTVKERQRQIEYQKRWPNEVSDLMQDPVKRSSHSTAGVLHCLIRGMGVNWVPGAGRPLIPSELWTAMGFSIDHFHQLQARARNQFSRGTSPTEGRTISSQMAAIGNTMHINVVGACCLFCVIKFPSLGTATGTTLTSARRVRRSRPEEPADVANADDAFAALFRTVRRRMSSQ